MRTKLGTIVQVGGSTDHEAIVGDQDLGVDVQLLAYESVQLRLLIAIPWGICISSSVSDYVCMKTRHGEILLCRSGPASI